MVADVHCKFTGIEGSRNYVGGQGLDPTWPEQVSPHPVQKIPKLVPDGAVGDKREVTHWPSM